MSRQVIHDGGGAFEIRFPFDRSLVDLIKTLPHRRWNASGRFWSVPDEDAVSLVDVLEGKGFRFDDSTRKIYEQLGGTLSLDNTAPASRQPHTPGLFDNDDEDAAAAESGAGLTGDYTVGELNERVRDVIESAFPAPVWIVGEISGFNKSAHRKHVGFQLVEVVDGRVASQISATLFERTRKSIERALRDAGEPFRLEDEVTVRVAVRVELYVPWGSYRVIVEDLDLNFTLGEAARRREEIIRQLTAEGILDLNSSLPLPALPMRVGVITSLGSDAYNDVLRSFQESGLAFQVTTHGARVQGRQTEPSVLNALDWFRERAGEFDAILICRGGGSRTDLAWFDSLALGRAVACFPLPVIVGIGHEQDRSVLDAVGRTSRTPTAAATRIVESVRDYLERVERLGRQLLESVERTLREEADRGIVRLRRLGLAARSLLEREQREMRHRQQRAVRGSIGLLATARARLDHWMRLIPGSASVQVQTRRMALDAASHAILLAARRDCRTARRELATHARGLAPRAERFLGVERQVAEGRERRLQLIDPRRVVERGYSILRLDDGRVLTDAALAPEGATVRAELRRGAVKLRSLGSDSTKQKKEEGR